MTSRRAADRLGAYLPIALMGVLALGTWWLVRNAPQPQPVAAPKPPAHVPDYTMHGFSVKSFDASGRQTSDVRGTLASHYPDTDTTEIEQVQLRSVHEDGSVLTATAKRALSNADGSEVQLLDDAVVTRTPAPAATASAARQKPVMQFRGDFLHVWVNEERVRSHLPVTLIRGKDRFTADAMDYDDLAQVLQLHGQVRGELAPQSPAAAPARAR
ncbi:LPS export ABC transporter periplasmic protein LptC [Comamonas faecalis]|uniref:LPS export ABC transporter periplasmic protein LptC n=1 Tax=Comamonas faecalis TaxID=1387849 RepID=A0ABP7QTM6_9BURK